MLATRSRKRTADSDASGSGDPPPKRPRRDAAKNPLDRLAEINSTARKSIRGPKPRALSTDDSTDHDDASRHVAAPIEEDPIEEDVIEREDGGPMLENGHTELQTTVDDDALVEQETEREEEEEDDKDEDEDEDNEATVCGTREEDFGRAQTTPHKKAGRSRCWPDPAASREGSDYRVLESPELHTVRDPPSHQTTPLSEQAPGTPTAEANGAASRQSTSDTSKDASAPAAAGWYKPQRQRKKAKAAFVLRREVDPHPPMRSDDQQRLRPRVSTIVGEAEPASETNRRKSRPHVHRQGPARDDQDQECDIGEESLFVDPATGGQVEDTAKMLSRDINLLTQQVGRSYWSGLGADWEKRLVERQSGLRTDLGTRLWKTLCMLRVEYVQIPRATHPEEQNARIDLKADKLKIFFAEIEGCVVHICSRALGRDDRSDDQDAKKRLQFRAHLADDVVSSLIPLLASILKQAFLLGDTDAEASDANKVDRKYTKGFMTGTFTYCTLSLVQRVAGWLSRLHQALVNESELQPHSMYVTDGPDPNTQVRRAGQRRELRDNLDTISGNIKVAFKSLGKREAREERLRREKAILKKQCEEKEKECERRARQKELCFASIAAMRTTPDAFEERRQIYPDGSLASRSGDFGNGGQAIEPYQQQRNAAERNTSRAIGRLLPSQRGQPGSAISRRSDAASRRPWEEDESRQLLRTLRLKKGHVDVQRLAGRFKRSASDVQNQIQLLKVALRIATSGGSVT